MSTYMLRNSSAHRIRVLFRAARAGLKKLRFDEVK